MKKFYGYISKNYSALLVLGLIIGFCGMRLSTYGDIQLSIAGNDTQSYIDASHAPLFSSEILTGRRLLSTNLLYKFFEPKDGYKIIVNGSIETTRRIVQPSFTGIVGLQLILSLFGWGFLAFIVANHLDNLLTKILAVSTILLFAFTPQIADWDSILMSESLTFSLFALEIGLTVKIVFMIFNNQNHNIKIYLLFGAIVHFIWTFLRDTNLFVSLLTFSMIALILFSVHYRKNKNIHSVLIFFGFIFTLGLITASNSTRSQVQLINLYQDDLLPNAIRFETLKELGMPDPNTPEYQTWFSQNAGKALIQFMIKHPGYPIIKILSDFPFAFTEIKQTYFKAPELNPTREILMNIGNALHPENTTPFLASLVLLIGFIHLFYKNIPKSKAWAWIGLWLFLCASITLIPTILGDTWALNRHALFSTTLYRLFMWLFTIVLIDISLQQKNILTT